MVGLTNSNQSVPDVVVPWVARTGVGIAGLLFALLAVSSASVQAETTYGTYLRYEPTDENYLVGTLTWNHDQGGIFWEGQPSTSDPGAGTGAVISFTSEPLSSPLYLNASRLIQVDLFLARGSSGEVYEYLNVDLKVDDQPLASSRGFGQFNGIYPTYRPTNPPGFALKQFRMQAEQDTIPAGKRIVLQFSYEVRNCITILPSNLISTGDSPCKYSVLGAGNPVYPRLGFGPGHASVLRIPRYSLEDAYLRVPRLAAGDDANAGPPVAPTGGSVSAKDPGSPSFIGASALAFGVVQLSGGSAPRRRAALVVLAIGVGILAGCVGPSTPNDLRSPASTAGLIRSTFHPDNASGVAGTGTGTLVGIVYDIDEVPVSGARVWLVGFTFVDTDSGGKFSFRNILAKEYVLRVNRTGFLPTESTVLIREGGVTTTKVQLDPIVLRSGSDRFHRHDYWESDAVEILDQYVTPATRTPTASTNTCTPLTSNAAPSAPPVVVGTCYAQFKLQPQPNFNGIIKPGTSEIEVSITWDGSPDIQAKVGFVANHERPWITPDHHLRSEGNWTWMMPRSSPAVTRIATGWEMADTAHQDYSTWVFAIASEPTTKYSGYESYSAVVPTFHVKITLHKGVVPLAPPHRDFWKGSDAFTVVNREMATACSGCTAAEKTTDGYVLRANWRPVNLTPPETQWIETRLEPDGHGDDYPWKLWFKTATTPYSGFYFGHPDYQTIPTNVGPPWTSRVRVGEQDPDGAYAFQTQWNFVVEDNNWVQGHHVSTPGGSVEPFTDPLYPKDYVFHLTVIAHRDSFPEG